ncbi:MAG TPA: carboxypeptidase regulatory-like domain-containing protein, partial [Vicinamibacteria bacterium]
RPSASERAGRGGMFFVELPGRRGGGGPSAQSAADGGFRVAGLAPGAYALSARKDGYADAGLDPVRVEREEPAPPVELRLPPGATIRGHVRHPDGTPAKRQMVRARPEGGSDPGAGPLGLGPLEPTGEDGAFAIEGLRAGESYTLNILGPPGPQAPPRLTGVRAPADDVELLVPGVGRIAGRVVDAQSREPLAEFAATYEPEMPQGMGMRFMRAPRRLARRLGTPDEEGTFRSPDGSFTLEEVPAGTFAVVVEAPGYESARVSGVVVREGEATADVEVRATRGRALRGRVLDGVTGRPVVGATVSAQGADRPGPPLPMGFEDGASFTDADGRFDLPGLGLGMVKLVARHPEYSESSRLVDVQNAQAEVEIRLSNGGALGGTVVSEAGAPVGGASVALQDGGGGGAGFRIGPGGGGGGPQTLSDEGGGFRFDRLASGRYTVTASLRGRSSAPLDIALQAGETRGDLRVSLEAGATLRGRVVGLDATQLSATNVSASGPQGYFAGVRPTTDGGFTLGGVPSGSIDLRAMAGDFSSGVRMASAQVEIAEGQTEAEAEIAFEAQGAIAGRVHRGGEGVGEVMLSASGPGGPAAFTRTDSSGAYRIEGLRDGSYTITASPPGGAAHHKSVEVAGEATLDFDLPLARIAGSVREAGSGLPLGDAEVEADSGEAGSTGTRGLLGRGRPRATTDSNGRFALEGLTPGPATLTARRTGFVYERRSVEASEGDGPELTLELKRGEGLGLRARDAALGVPLHTVFAEARDASGAAVFTGPLSLDSEGRGEVPSLRPGAYTVRLSSFGYAPTSFRATVPSPTLDVALGQGGTLEVRTGPDTQARAPRARLLDGAGSPVLGPPIGPDGFVALTGATRRLEHLAPGGYALAVEGGPTKPFTVAEGGTAVVELP